MPPTAPEPALGFPAPVLPPGNLPPPGFSGIPTLGAE